MSVSLSPLFNGWQGFSIAGLPLAGGLLNTYAAGTTTPLATYTDNTGETPNNNPIQLDAAGLPPNEIWLTSGVGYKFVLTDSLGANPRTFDNVFAPDPGGLSVNLAASSGSSLVGWIQAGVSAVARAVQSKLREIISSADFNNTRGTDNYGFGTSAIASMQPSGAGTAVQCIGIGTNALAANTTGFANTAIGHLALSSTVANCYATAVGAFALQNANLVGNVNLLCTAVGAYALNSNTSGQYNTAVGATAGQFNTDGFFNTYVGKEAGKLNSHGLNNTALGHAALLNNEGSSNVAIGNKAMWMQTTASNTIAIGDGALTNGTGGISQCVAIGTNALALTSGGQHVAIGYRAGESTQTGTGNTYVGWQSGLAVTGPGGHNTFVGHEAGTSMTSNSDNTAIGYQALRVSINGGSVAVGSGALVAQTNGGAHCAVGTGAGANVTTGANNHFFGNQAGTDALANVTTASNQLVMGNTNITNAFVKVAWTVVSDARDKTEFADLEHGLDFTMKLSPKSFKLMDRATKQATTGKRYGFLAQDILELEGASPVLIDTHDLENLKFNESMLVPILVKAIQELQARVEALEAR